MVVHLNREEIEVAIREYVENKILGYGNKTQFTMNVVQGKSASAKVELKKEQPDISE